ncbi:MAG: DUF86 domain-containing protein [Sulfuricurvum sp.]|nr:DUF86 domain-containing protein [Sulfuricurvum sp.]
MYDEKNLIYIMTMLECTEKVWIYSGKYTTASDFIWADEQQPLNGVISLFIAIGEESKKIDKNLKKDILTQMDWMSVAGIRDKISHDYRGIDEAILWNTIKKELVVLKNALVEMVDLINPSKEILNGFLESPYYRHLGYLR